MNKELYETLLLSSIGLFFTFIIIGAAFTVASTIRGKGRLGINTSPVHCPNCNQLMPTIRKPQNLRQSLWGGWTCKCGCEMNKWGVAINAAQQGVQADVHEKP